MASQLAVRIIEAVRLLHRMGYAGLRVVPGMNASGTAWRIVIFNVTEWDNTSQFGAPFEPRESCLYSTAANDDFNNHIQFPSDVSCTTVAEAILAEMPSLQRTALSATGNKEYVHWYAQLASQVHGLSDLPIAYADYFDNAEGWAIGWGSQQRVPHPPTYIAEAEEASN